MKKIKTLWMGFILLCGLTTTSCNNDDKPTFPETEETNDPTGGYDMTGFVRGADVSWLTEMEASGRKFYDSKGKERGTRMYGAAPRTRNERHKAARMGGPRSRMVCQRGCNSESMESAQPRIQTHDRLPLQRHVGRPRKTDQTCRLARLHR